MKRLPCAGKCEVPKRSINEIIRILEWEGCVQPGTLKRSTLQDQLSNMAILPSYFILYE